MDITNRWTDKARTEIDRQNVPNIWTEQTRQTDILTDQTDGQSIQVDIYDQTA